VFFVISGYLITTLICQQDGAGRFTLTGFCARRIRRIFLALVLVLLSTTAVSMIVMPPPDSIRFGSSVIASLSTIVVVGLARFVAMETVRRSFRKSAHTGCSPTLPEKAVPVGQRAFDHMPPRLCSADMG